MSHFNNSISTLSVKLFKTPSKNVFTTTIEKGENCSTKFLTCLDRDKIEKFNFLFFCFSFVDFFILKMIKSFIFWLFCCNDFQRLTVVPVFHYFFFLKKDKFAFQDCVCLFNFFHHKTWRSTPICYPYFNKEIINF